MKRKSIAMLLALALVLSLCAVTAAAGEQAQDQRETAGESRETAGEDEAVPEGGTAEEETEPDSPAGPDTEPGTGPEAGEAVENSLIEPDAVGTVSFANLERRMRENNLTILTLDQTIEMLQDIDYEQMGKDLLDGVNQAVVALGNMRQYGGVVFDFAGNPIGSAPACGQMAVSSMEQQYEAVKKQYEAFKDGDIQEDNAGRIRQLKATQDQLVLAGESTYIALAALETQEGALQRQLSALNRTVEELELRYQMGQISALQLQQAKAGRSQLTSGLETLRMNIRNLKYQFEMLLGADQTGEISLGPVPEVTEKQLAAMDVEKDLLAAKAKSYDLYAAAKTLEDAQETYTEDARANRFDEKEVDFRNAKRTWQAAQYTYNSTVQDYELKFRTLYAQVQDYKQILDAAKVSLECEKTSCAASELKFKQGTISQNALLDARDALREAEEKVASAANDLFSSYNTYCWAVEHGVLN